MFDGSILPLEENMEISKKLLAECAELDIILEIEAGVVGGEEDGHDTSGLPAKNCTQLLKTWYRFMITEWNRSFLIRGYIRQCSRCL